MGKRDLKKQYPELEFNFVDLVGLLDTTPTKKLTPFLVKQFNDWIQYRPDEKMNGSSEYETLRRTLGDPKNELDEIVKRMVFKWAQPKLEIIKEFTEHMEANRLTETDINKYNNWNAIKLAVNEAEIKHGIKNKKNRVMILHSDDEWLVLKPLSIEASINYGYGTKWCTSMKNSGSYFHKYSKNGVLVFVINRKNGVKYAIYSSPKEYSVWTATDARIDSMETTIPFDLMMRMREWTNFDEVGPNYNYFEDEDKEGRKKGKLVALRALRNEPIPEEDREVMGYDEEEGDIVEASITQMVEVTTANFVGHSESDEAPAPSDPDVTFRADTWETEVGAVPEVEYGEEVMDEYEDMEAPREEMFSVTASDMVNIVEEDEMMVGHGHSVHGSITEQGERTWESPYPNGPGGGFENYGGITEEESMTYDSEEISDEQWESAVPADEDTAEAMGMEFDERDGYEDERAG
jgi:hypothetical protein